MRPYSRWGAANRCKKPRVRSPKTICRIGSVQHLPSGGPARVTFEAEEDHKLTYSVREHAAHLVDRITMRKTRKLPSRKNFVVRTVWEETLLSAVVEADFVRRDRQTLCWRRAVTNPGIVEPQVKSADKSVRPTRALLVS